MFALDSRTSDEARISPVGCADNTAGYDEEWEGVENGSDDVGDDVDQVSAVYYVRDALDLKDYDRGRWRARGHVHRIQLEV